jgi:3-hydroxybutyryl-CoA dehydrogenase
MGHGIAYVAALAGCEVALHDSRADALPQARAKIDELLAGAVRRGKITAEESARVAGRVHVERLLDDAVKGAGLVIEAVVEDLVVKHLMRLVEVVTHGGAERSVSDRAMAFARQLGKEPIVVKDSPGFASSRLGVVLGLEAMRMLEQGVASAEDIDKAMELGYNHPMGPLKLTDLVGLDVRLAIAQYLHATLKLPHYEPPAILRDKVRKGELGKKTGKGFYSWSD